MLKQLLTTAVLSGVIVASAASPASAEPVAQPGGAIVDIDRIVLNTGAEGQGGWASGWMEGWVTNMPAGTHELWAHLDVTLTFGCVNRAARSVPGFEEHHAFGASWRAWHPDAPAGITWGPRIGLGEDFGMWPYPFNIPPVSCPRGLAAAFVGSEVTSATVQYSHNGVEGSPIEVEGVFSYEPAPPV